MGTRTTRAEFFIKLLQALDDKCAEVRFKLLVEAHDSRLGVPANSCQRCAIGALPNLSAIGCSGFVHGHRERLKKSCVGIGRQIRRRPAFVAGPIA